MKKVHFYFPLVLFLISCSQNLPELNNVTATSVFEYAENDSLPELRLEVFVDATSDVHRAEKIRIVCSENDYQWECLNPVKFESGKKKYAGFTSFVMPDNKPFPQGRYVVWYIDSNGNEESCVMNVSFTNNLVKMTALEAQEYVKKNNGIENLAVFDETSKLIFYGQKESDFETKYAWERFPHAEYIKFVWTLNNGRELIILPSIYKDVSDFSKTDFDSIENEENTGDFINGVRDFGSTESGKNGFLHGAFQSFGSGVSE